MIISWLLRTNQIRWFYFSIFLTCPAPNPLDYRLSVPSRAGVIALMPRMQALEDGRQGSKAAAATDEGKLLLSLSRW